MSHTPEKDSGKTIAFIGVPIKAANETLGVLSIDRIMDNCRHRFDHDVRILTMVANLVGQSVRLQRMVAAEHMQLLEDKKRLKKELQGRYNLDNVIGISKAMQEVFAQVHQSAPSRSTMLLRGESGTGKEVIAPAIHYLSPRKDGPFSMGWRGPALSGLSVSGQARVAVALTVKPPATCLGFR